MTTKEALAVLYRFYDAFWDKSLHRDSQKAQERKEQIGRAAYRALRKLTPTIHGKAPLHLSDYLCEGCYLRYAELPEEGGLLCPACQVEAEKRAAASLS